MHSIVSSASMKGFSENIKVYKAIPHVHMSNSGPKYLLPKRTSGLQ